MKLSRLVILTVSLVALFLAACGGDSAPAETESQNSTIDVLQNDIYYGDSPDNADNPPVWNASAGGAIRVRANNAGTLQHNFAVVRLDADIPDVYTDDNSDIILAQTGLVEPGEERTETIDALEPGEYVVICTVAGHWPSMQGRLVVE